ncbi:taste receptor type 2 member 31-like [Oryctolagus cuniculus]|nr:taste receptor type 2 member 31-like [Oryctolagus cuniculus]
MFSLLPIIISILVLAEFVLGNFANAFITLVICTDWVKRRKLSLVDWILVALAVSRIALLWVILIYWNATIVNPTSYNLSVIHTVTVAWAVTNHFSVWLATSLSIFYLLKIANFSNLIFLHLKRNADKVILFVLPGSFVVFFCYLSVKNMEWIVRMSENEGNVTWKTDLLSILHISDLSLLTITNLIPFTTSLICFLLLIYSLCKHLRKMQLHGRRLQDPSTKVHVKALQTVISFLLLFVIYFLSVIISVWSYKRQKNVPVFSLGQAIELIYPLSHSVVLIFGNRKLKEAFLLLVWHVRHWLIKTFSSVSIRK